MYLMGEGLKPCKLFSLFWVSLSCRETTTSFLIKSKMKTIKRELFFYSYICDTFKLPTAVDQKSARPKVIIENIIS